MRWFVVLGTLLAVAAADAQACHRGGGRGGLFGRRRQADACCESVSMVSYAPAAAPCCPDSGVYPGRIAPQAVPPPAEAAPPPAASQLAPAPTPPPPQTGSLHPFETVLCLWQRTEPAGTIVPQPAFLVASAAAC